jgi:hypothetical protein
MEGHMRQSIVRIIPKALMDKFRPSQSFETVQMKECRKLASTSKRLDICSAQLAHILHLSNCAPLAGKVCLELGSGWVLSHALVMYLLGAKKVIATDVVYKAFPQFLSYAVRGAIQSVVRDILSPFEDHELLRGRLKELMAIDHFDFDVLQRLGINYLAPIDFAKEKLDTQVDFLYSNAVLEHVPVDDVALMLPNLAEILKRGGCMVHCIHTEDHKNIYNTPFEFLSIPSENYPTSIQSSRGNRLRKSAWMKIFNGLENTNTKIIYDWVRKDKDLPERIDSSIDYCDENDLRTSHIGVLTRKV